MRVFRYQANQSDWDGFATLPLQQSWAYGQASGNPLRFRIDAGQAKGQAQLVYRGTRFGGIGLLSRGIIWDQPLVSPWQERAAYKAISSELPGLSALIVTPETGKVGFPLMTPATVAEVSLSVDPTRMRQGLHGKWRNRLCRAEESGLCITRAAAGPETLSWLLCREAEQQRRQGYRNLPAEFLRRWAWCGQAEIFCAKQGDDTIAAMLFLRHGGVVSYQIGWSNAAGRIAGAHNLLMWRAMEYYGAKGCERLDLGMLDTEGATGLARFKLGTGAVARRLGATGLVLPKVNLATKGRWRGRQSAPQP